MRFIKDGPSIPDDLLIARDEGRVVFFCGAGVSRARAVLPDFFGLARNVITQLHVPPDGPVCKILQEAQEIHKRTGVSGLISADRIFGLLEREFLVRDIEREVASALKPSDKVDTSAHRILIDLATTAEGKVRLITTNFDRLFEKAAPSLTVWYPPRLPDPSREEQIDGIIHLHGLANSDYSGAEGDGFILSSPEFGRAYLADGWATDFVRKTLSKYVVVFVGYSADDPPVQYLLEALNRSPGQQGGIYAFQAGDSDDATARWIHKGVEAIAYSDRDGHCALWDTLTAWSQRAKAPDAWYESIVAMASEGPEHLEPYQRGQIAHVISTAEGARKFSTFEPPPPANWLTVFDPYVRYGAPGRTGGGATLGPFVDPFEIYGLDADLVPQKIDPDDFNKKREVPSGAWDGLAANRLDRQSLRHDSISAFRGHWARNAPRLAPRLNDLGLWLARVAHQPAAVWWAANQTGLHPELVDRIKWAMERWNKDAAPGIRRAWRYLFEVWDERRKDHNGDWYDLQGSIGREGWDSAAIRRFAVVSRPYLKVGRNFWGGPKPPEARQDLTLSELVRVDIEHPDAQFEAEIPDEYLEFLVGELRKNLHHAVVLETELGGYGLTNISPIEADLHADGDHYSRTHGLSGAVLWFVRLFERLIEIDPEAAKRELAAWPENDPFVFARLRIRIAGMAKATSGALAGSIILSLDDRAFWDSHHQRDLLLTLARRWKSLPQHAQRRIEKRLRNGPKQWPSEEHDEFEKRRAWAILDRLNWLAENGCGFSFDVANETSKLRKKVREWKKEYASKAAESLESRSGVVKIDSEHSALLQVPLASVLSRAVELAGRTEDFLVERDPFAGMAKERPARAFAALVRAGKGGEFPEWAWRTFLNSEARKDDKIRLSLTIAKRICSYSPDRVMSFLRSAADWLLATSKTLSHADVSIFDQTVQALTRILQQYPEAARSAVGRTKSEQPDWTMEAINAPVGKIAQALFEDPRKDGLRAEIGFDRSWLVHVEALLALPGDLRRHALVIFGHNLNWFYYWDHVWAERHLLSALDQGDKHDFSAVWSGFLWGAKVPQRELFVRIKSHLLRATQDRWTAKRGYDHVLAGMVLAGWGTRDPISGERLVSNHEMHQVLLHTTDEFRSRILWQLENWSKKDEGATVNWPEMLPEFLERVWPRQRAVKTPAMSARLCDLAFGNKVQFRKIANIILPLLTTIDREHIRLHNLHRSDDTVADQHPRETLALLHAVLPDNVASWPYGIESVLKRIADADTNLRLDERLIELNRKWNAR